MKNIFALITFSFLFLLTVKGVTSSPMEEVEKVHVLHTMDMQADNHTFCVFSSSIDFSNGILSSETQTIARQLRVSGRNHRHIVFHYSMCGKWMVERIAMMRMHLLAQLFTHSYSTDPFQSWEVASDHYVFGMRRILI